MMTEKNRIARTQSDVEALDLSVEVPPGARSLLGVLAQEHTVRLARLLRYLGVPASDIEDALQDVYLIAYRRLADEPGVVREPGAWLRGVAINVARNRSRSRKRNPVRAFDEAPEIEDGETPEQQLEAKRRRALLQDLLDELPYEQRTVVVLFEIDGLPMREIAELLTCALPTAYKYLHRGQTKLRESFARRERGRDE